MCWEWKSLRSCEGDKRSRLGWRGELLMFGYHRFWRCLNFIIFYPVSSQWIIFYPVVCSRYCRLREVLDTPEPESTTAATPSAQEVGFCLKSSRTCVVFFYIKLPSKYKGEQDMVFESETKINTHTVGYLSCSNILDWNTCPHVIVWPRKAATLFSTNPTRFFPMTFRSALWISLRSNCWGNLRRRRSGIIGTLFENDLTIS